jgi:Tfp pilus assembly protein PilO
VAHILKLKPGIFLWIAISMLGALGTAWLFIYPAYIQFTKQEAEFQQVSKNVIRLETFARSHPDSTRYLAELQRRELFLAKVLPDSPNIGDYLDQVERCAVQAKVEIIQILPVNSSPKSDYNVTTVKIAVRGDFLATLRFTKLLEDSSRFSTINDIELHETHGVMVTMLTVAIYNTFR